MHTIVRSFALFLLSNILECIFVTIMGVHLLVQLMVSLDSVRQPNNFKFVACPAARLQLDDLDAKGKPCSETCCSQRSTALLTDRAA